MKLKNLLMLIAMLAMLAGSAGCIFSPDDSKDPPPEVEALPKADTPDQMMANFKVIYEDMMYDEYESLLHDDYRTVLLQTTFDEWADGDNPLAELYFDKTLETTIHRNMFDGLTGIGPGGEPIPPIDSINVTTLDKDGTWDVVEPSTEYFGGFEGAYKAQFNVLLHFNNPDQHRYEVDQTVEFYAIQIGDEWFMLGQVGFENTK